MKPNEAEILVAKSSAVFRDRGQIYRIVGGKTTARSGAKILKGREHMFEPLVVDFENERSVSTPIEEPKRGPGRPPKNTPDTSGEAARKEIPAKAVDGPRPLTTKDLPKKPIS